MQMNKAPNTQAKGRASDHDRDDVASEQKRFIMDPPALSNADDFQRNRAGEEQDYFSPERAEFDANNEEKSMHATGQEFFRRDEAARGEADNCNVSIKGRSEQYMSKEHPVIGKDGYEKETETNEKYKDGTIGTAQGRVTPAGDRDAVSVNYLDKSDAEYGRPGTGKSLKDKEKYFVPPGGKAQENPHAG